MKLIFRILLISALLPTLMGMQADKYGQLLFNGKDLTDWDTYLGPDQDDSGKFINETPIGINNDPRHVFSVVNEDGRPAIRISGESRGALITKADYANYHLHLQFKWGSLIWGDKKGKKKDSGVLYHSVGPYGVDFGAWMRSQEFQIEEGNCGDYWGVAGGAADIPALKSGEDFVYTRNGPLLTFAEKSPQGRHCVKNGDAEKLTGKWNTLDLYCHGDTSVHMVNGKVMMVLFHDRQITSGKELPLKRGRIQLQSEGAEIFYRNISLIQIDRIPEAVFQK